jgi:cold shock CspA family protein
MNRPDDRQRPPNRDILPGPFTRQALKNSRSEGQQVVCDAVLTPKGLNAVRFEMRGEILQPAPRATNLDVDIPEIIPEKDRVDDVATVVKWFNNFRGYGFLVAEQADTRINTNLDVFVHAETVRASGFTRLEPNDRVRADVWLRGPKGNGLMAAAIRPAARNGGAVKSGSSSRQITNGDGN